MKNLESVSANWGHVQPYTWLWYLAENDKIL